MLNAEAHGAAGVLIFNEGTFGDPDRNGPIGGTLAAYTVTAPVVEFDLRGRRYLVDHPTATLDLAVFSKTELLETRT